MQVGGLDDESHSGLQSILGLTSILHALLSHQVGIHWSGSLLTKNLGDIYCRDDTSCRVSIAQPG